MTRHPTRRFGCACLFLALACGSQEDPAEHDQVPSEPLLFPDEPFRFIPPVPGESGAFGLPVPARFTLAGGVEVTLVERHQLPILNWYLSLPSGYLADPPGKEGLASLCLNVMFQGSKTLPRAAREQALADTAAAINVSVGPYDVSVGGDCLAPDLDSTLQIWSDLVLDPALQREMFSGTVRARQAALAAGSSSTPATVAGRVSSRLFWGMDHPFSREATQTSFATVTLNDCESFATNFLQPSGAKLFIAGDITQAGVEEKFGEKLAGLTARAAPPQLVVPDPAPATGSLFFVDSPGASQSIITLLARGPARSSPNYYPAEIMVNILAGSSLTSRLGLNLREMKGYTYSVDGGFVYGPTGSILSLNAPVVKDATAPSVFEMLEEIEKMRETEVTDEEFSRERDNLIAGLPYRFETASDTLDSYFQLALFGLPLTHFESFSSSLSAVTKAQVREVADHYLKPELLQILVVGDGATVLPTLRELATQHPALAGREVVILDARGNQL